MSLTQRLLPPPETNGFVKTQRTIQMQRCAKTAVTQAILARTRIDEAIETPTDLDREIAVQARAKLDQSSYRAVRQVSCKVREGSLTLHGRVPTYYMKQIAQTLVRHVEGIVVLDNQLEVGRV